MSLLALFGTGYNQLARMATAATPTPAEDSLFPIANLYAGKPWQPFRFSWSLSSMASVLFDLNQVVNGDFETAFTGGLPGTAWADGANAGWTSVLGGTYTRNTASPKNGSGCLEVTGDGGKAAYIINAASGEELTAHVWLRNNGAGTATVQIFNLDTEYYLTSGGTWSATSADWATNATSTYTEKSSTFTVQAYATTGRDRTRLMFTFNNAGYYDDFFVWPSISFASLHGHNLIPYSWPLTLDSGTTSSPATNRGNLAFTWPTAFATCTLTAERYWRVRVTNSPFVLASTISVAPFYGELVLGQYQTLSRAQSYPYSEDRTEPQDRSEAGIAAYLRSTSVARELQLRFDYRAADYTQAKEMLERSRNGAHPLVLADSSDSASALLCRVADKWQGSVQSNVLRQSSLTFTELPFPTVLP